MNTDSVLLRFFEEPGGHIVLDPTLRVVDVGPEFLRLTKSRRESVMGKYFIDTLTEPNPQRHAEVAAMLRHSLWTATNTLQPDKMPDFRCDVQSEGRTEERWWRSASIPVLDHNGELEYIVHRVEDISLLRRTARALSAQRKSNYILYLLVIFAVVLASYFGKSNNNRIATQSRQTCLVQHKSLPVQKALSSVMTDMNGLLLAIPNPPHSMPSPRFTTALRTLEYELQTYTTLEAKVPASRTCPQ